ncbi:hypothetical protein Q8A73_019481 [Channa argus]|nr:hypothetical protein Q8A73_019481 [Channa argus]
MKKMVTVQIYGHKCMTELRLKPRFQRGNAPCRVVGPVLMWPVTLNLPSELIGSRARQTKMLLTAEPDYGMAHLIRRFQCSPLEAWEFLSSAADHFSTSPADLGGVISISSSFFFLVDLFDKWRRRYPARVTPKTTTTLDFPIWYVHKERLKVSALDRSQ